MVVARGARTFYGVCLALGVCAVFVAPVRGELVVFYDFNDASNADAAVDLSGNGNDGEIIGAAYTGPGGGRTGGGDDRALDFLDFNDGTYLGIPSAADGAFDGLTANDSATIAFWLYGGDEQPVNQWHFWFGPGRQLGSHVPWGDGTIYFDVSGCCNAGQRINLNEPDESLYLGQWTHYAFVKDVEYTAVYQNGEVFVDSGNDPKLPLGDITEVFFGAGDSGAIADINGLMDDIGVWDTGLSQAEIQQIMTSGLATGTRLQAGDADQDLDFDQLDLVRVQVAARYLSGQPATWGQGDWDGAPGGSQGSPPPGDGAFNELDIIAALNAGKYLMGPYGALANANGVRGDAQTSITYHPGTGEVAVDAPAGVSLTSVNIDSAGRIFTGAPAQNLGGSFDNDADNNIFKATFGSSFGTISFGAVAQPGLSRDFVLNDLTVVGSLAGGGALGNVDLIYIPEPSAALLMLVGVGISGLIWRKRSV